MRTLADLAFGHPHAITRDKLDVIIRSVVLPHLAGGVPQAALTVDPERSDRKPYSVTPDGVAVIDVDGTLVRKTSSMSAISGLTSYQQLSQELSTALADVDVRGILLRCDSPGGEVGGLFDFVDELFAARGKKPIYAVAAEMAFSACYAIASAADRIFVTRTGGVGSIGIVCCHADESGADRMAGLKYEYIYAGSHKIDGNPHEPLSDSARDVLQAEIDRMDTLLTTTVARNRGMKAQAIRDMQAAMFFADDAIDAGLADAIGTEDDACGALVAAIQGLPFQGRSLSFSNAKAGERTVSASHSPGIVAACIKQAGRMTGKVETPPVRRQASSGPVRACLAMSQQTRVETAPQNARKGGPMLNCIALGRLRRAEASQRPKPNGAHSGPAQIEALPGKMRTGGLLSKCLAIRSRMEAEAGQKPADAPTGGVLAKTRAIAARMGATSNGVKRLEEEKHNA